MARILVVDDDEYVLEILQVLLEAEGYAAITASSGPKALEMLKAHKVDMIISDVRMNPMNGIELLRTVRKDSPLLPVVMLTAYGSEETAAEATSLGAQGYLTKPFTGDEVLDHVKRAVGASGTGTAFAKAN